MSSSPGSVNIIPDQEMVDLMVNLRQMHQAALIAGFSEEIARDIILRSIATMLQHTIASASG